jgi:hypothetical protein
MKETMKWRYDKKNKQWWIPESAPYANDGLQIDKIDCRYRLWIDGTTHSHWFKKLSSAKKVAELLIKG